MAHTTEDCRGWTSYPEGLFENWISNDFSGLWGSGGSAGQVALNMFDLGLRGKFSDLVTYKDRDILWSWMHNQVHRGTSDLQVRVVFLRDLPLDVLKMIGTRYIIQDMSFFHVSAEPKSAFVRKG
ncbi:hypothetical protein JAAARDRAFT_210978 [Jaapia argillacea MUCL 33604]|uniref:Uncharacterized protein n=1 Tax=Jaapia argillacea MUCL 33604 TaxID=933084 RepID=A0A067PMZ7_9AGAM|nr:hypothetical protein JAAARDRAFT_210978 [Jaapia argillacea MUCL 33604]